MVRDANRGRLSAVRGPLQMGVGEFEQARGFFIRRLGRADDGSHIETQRWVLGKQTLIIMVSATTTATGTGTNVVRKQLVVFDFDWCVWGRNVATALIGHTYPRSLADQDSDRWVFEVLAIDIRRNLRTLAETVQWTDLM